MINVLSLGTIVALQCLCPEWDGVTTYPYVEDVIYPDDGLEYRELQKPVITGVHPKFVETIGDTDYITCELEIDYRVLEKGEGIYTEGDSFGEVEYLGIFHHPDDIPAYVATYGCELTETPDLEGQDVSQE